MEGKMSMDLNKGQHFLINKEIIKEEIRVANIKKIDKIIEIGAGDGKLTLELIKNSEEVLAFEIDTRYKEELLALQQKSRNLKIVYDDALSHSWKGYNKIVSNIPYYITEGLIMKSIKEEIPELVLIVGEKFKESLENNKTKTGILSNLFYNSEIIMKVEKESFSPPPRVNSWMIKLTKKEKFFKNEEIILSIIKREGKIKNAILYSLVNQGMTKNEARKIIGTINLDKGSLEKKTSKMTDRLLGKIIKEVEKIR